MADTDSDVDEFSTGGMNEVLKSLHDLADRLGRPTGRYIPDVKIVEAAISKIIRLEKSIKSRLEKSIESRRDKLTSEISRLEKEINRMRHIIEKINGAAEDGQNGSADYAIDRLAHIHQLANVAVRKIEAKGNTLARNADETKSLPI